MRYQGSRWLMGRAVLKNLKESTLLRFFEICKDWGLIKGIHFKYNSVEATIKFLNGSEVYLKALETLPSDPEFDSLGSTEYTGAFIDEGAQISAKAKDIVMTRLRYKLDLFGIAPKLLIASNPCKNFLYYDYYKKWKDGTLPAYRAFVRSLVTDNPYMPKEYEEQLKKADKRTQERLLHGNFEYDDDPATLMEYDAILDIFSNGPQGGKLKYLSADIGRFGADKTTIFIWRGFFIEAIYTYHKKSTKESRDIIDKLGIDLKIPRSRMVIDDDGIGGGVTDYLEGVYRFINGSKPVEEKVKYDHNKEFYANLKSQCYFKLADHVNRSLIGCYRGVDGDTKELLIEDLEQVKRKDPDKEGRISVVPKEKVKELLRGRSPDFSDAMMMRMVFELGMHETEFFFA